MNTTMNGRAERDLRIKKRIEEKIQNKWNLSRGSKEK